MKKTKNKIKVLENDVKASIINLIQLYSKYMFVWKQNNQGTFNRKLNIYTRFNGLAGVPDIIGMTRTGRFIGIECKRSGAKGEQSDNQKTFQANCEKMGGIYILADCIEDCKPTFDKIKRGLL